MKCLPARCVCLAASLVLSATVAAQGGANRAAFSDWEPALTTADGTSIGLNLKLQRDGNWFTDDRGDREDPAAARRHEVGFFIRKDHVYDAAVSYDFLSHTWLDVFARVQAGAFTGRDMGALRAGYIKTPVGFEGNTSTGSTTFMEPALPSQAIYAGRRTGFEWSLLRDHGLVTLAYYMAGDLQGGNDGHGAAARVAWIPLHEATRVLHIGTSASREHPEWTTDGRGMHYPPTVRLSAEPEGSLVDATIVDSGSLANARAATRRGLELFTMRGSLSLQAECLAARVSFRDGRRPFHASGYYLATSWVLTGENRTYAGGNVSDVHPSRRWGAVEIAARFSEINLDDGPIQGGRVHQWTLGTNWYLGRHIKFQANWVHSSANRADPSLSPDLAEVRAQLMF